MNKTICYARVSKLDMHPENQFNDLKRVAESIGQPYEIREERESTRNTRPIKEDIMNALRRREYDILIVWSVDRFARSSKELALTFDELKILKVRFVCIKNNLDLRPESNDPMQKFQFDVFAAFAELERSLISMRTKEGQARAIGEGKRIGRHPKTCFCGKCKNSKLNIAIARKNQKENGGSQINGDLTAEASAPIQTGVYPSQNEERI